MPPVDKIWYSSPKADTARIDHFGRTVRSEEDADCFGHIGHSDPWAGNHQHSEADSDIHPRFVGERNHQHSVASGRIPVEA